MLPGGWVTLRDVYHCAIDKELFARKIKQAQTYAADMSDEWITIAARELTGDHMTPLRAFGFQPDPAVLTYLNELRITHTRERVESTSAQEIRLRVEAVNRWYVHDWNTLDNKIRSSIVEGVSVFLSMFDLPSVARVFCPAAPEARRFHDPAGDAPGTDPTPLAATAMKGVDLPPLDALIERGKVLALNMPAGTNPALARAVGVMLKNAWLQSLLRRPARMKAEPMGQQDWGEMACPVGTDLGGTLMTQRTMTVAASGLGIAAVVGSCESEERATSAPCVWMASLRERSQRSSAVRVADQR